jgi:hypothetical protein
MGGASIMERGLVNIYRVVQIKWRSQYFVNISFNFHCLYLKFFLKDSPSNSLQECIRTFDLELQYEKLN